MLSGLRSKSWLVDLPLIALAWWAGFWLRFNLDKRAELLAMFDKTWPWPLLFFFFKQKTAYEIST